MDGRPPDLLRVGAEAAAVVMEDCSLAWRSVTWLRFSLPACEPRFLHVQTDFLIVVLRDVIQAYPEVRIVLMSATIDTSMFREYFFNCPIIEVFGRTFPVQGTTVMSPTDDLISTTTRRMARVVTLTVLSSVVS